MPDETPAVNPRGILTELLDVTARIDALTARKGELRQLLEAEARRRYAEDGAVPSWKVPRLGTATLAAADAEPNVDIVDAGAFATWLVDVYPTEVEQVITIAGTTLSDNPSVMPGAEGLYPLQDVVTALAAVPGITVALTPRTAILAVIVASGLADAETGHLVDQGGAIVDGVTVTPKTPYLSVRLNAEAKARARAALDVLDLPRPAAEHEHVYSTTPPHPCTEPGCTAALPRDAFLADVHAAAGDEDEGAGDAPPPDEAPAPAEGPERTSTITVGDPDPAPAEDPADLAARLDASYAERDL